MIDDFLLRCFIVIVIKVMYHVTSFMCSHVVRNRVADWPMQVKRNVIRWIMHVVTFVQFHDVNVIQWAFTTKGIR